MPPRQVYGKRSRALYDPFLIFGSLHDSPENVGKAALDISDVIKRDVQHESPKNAKNISRKPLGQINANTVTEPLTPTPKKDKKQHRQPTIVISEEKDDIEPEKEKPLDPAEFNVLRPPKQDLQGRAYGPGREDISSTVYEAPLFYDIHEYESEDEQWKTQSVSKEACARDTLDTYSSHCAGLLDVSSHSITQFSDWSSQLSKHFNVTKIAEASFGEVYRLSLLEQLAGFSSNDESVFKIIALRPPERESSTITNKTKRQADKKKIDNMSKPKDVANEVRLLQRMSSIPGFTNFRDVRVIQGRPPQPFVKAYKSFNASQKARKKEPSAFPDPGRKVSYPDDQLWAVIEMQDAGTDLEYLVENGQCSSIWQVWDIFWQVVLSLAKGEEGAEFEHRDLHLGNICIQQASKESSDIDTKRKLNFTAVEATIIDYTISRAVMPDNTIAYQDLGLDASLFEGDSTEEYQYDIYRYMRGAVFLDDPYAELCAKMEQSERSWEEYHPITNLIWLHFTLYKLLEQVNWPSAIKAPPRRQKAGHAQWKRGNDLEHVLLRVQDLLSPEMVYQSDIRSASDLVGLGLSEGWIDVTDVVGEESDDGNENAESVTEHLADLTLVTQPASKAITKAQRATRSVRAKSRRNSL